MKKKNNYFLRKNPLKYSFKGGKFINKTNKIKS